MNVNLMLYALLQILISHICPSGLHYLTGSIPFRYFSLRHSFYIHRTPQPFQFIILTTSGDCVTAYVILRNWNIKHKGIRQNIITTY
jgi:hypothetical protein